MDYTVATCGIRYHSSTVTLIRYDSLMDSYSTTENGNITTTVPPDIDNATTTPNSNCNTTTQGSDQTSDESETPPTTETQSSPTATLASVSLISGFGTGTFILVLLVIIYTGAGCRDTVDKIAYCIC